MVNKHQSEKLWFTLCVLYILVVHLFVVSVIVALTKNKVQVKYYIFLIDYHFTKVGFIVLKKEKKIGKTALNFNI